MSTLDKSILDQLKTLINAYLEALDQINNFERDKNGVPTVNGFKTLIGGLSKASNALARLTMILEHVQNDNPGSNEITELQKSVWEAVLNLNEKCKKFFTDDESDD